MESRPGSYVDVDRELLTVVRRKETPLVRTVAVIHRESHMQIVFTRREEGKRGGETTGTGTKTGKYTAPDVHAIPLASGNRTRSSE